MEKDLRAKRSAMHFKFRQASRNTGYEDEDDSVLYTLRSSSEVIQDWVMDCNLFDIKSTFERNLSIYPMEQLWVTPEKTKLLFLVSVDDDAKLLGSKGFVVNTQQQIEKQSIGGRLYYRLQCTIVTSNCDQLIHGVKNKTYTEVKFIDDYTKRNGDFQVDFDTTMHYHQFNWRKLMENPTSFKFFGPPR